MWHNLFNTCQEISQVVDPKSNVFLSILWFTSQGFQIMMDSWDGFSGLGCAGIQQLRDDYPSKTALCWAFQPPQLVESTSKHISLRLINQALAMSSLGEHSSLFCPVTGTTKAWRSLGEPVTFQHLRYKVWLNTDSLLIYGYLALCIVQLMMLEEFKNWGSLYLKIIKSF